jgi:predicted O-linked N-acetylglucosamine transferase (SPINDLY family)
MTADLLRSTRSSLIPLCAAVIRSSEALLTRNASYDAAYYHAALCYAALGAGAEARTCWGRFLSLLPGTMPTQRGTELPRRSTNPEKLGERAIAVFADLHLDTPMDLDADTMMPRSTDPTGLFVVDDAAAGTPRQASLDSTRSLRRQRADAAMDDDGDRDGVVDDDDDSGSDDDGIVSVASVAELRIAKAKAYARLGSRFEERKLLDIAARCYWTALELQPNDASILHRVGVVYRKHAEQLADGARRNRADLAQSVALLGMPKVDNSLALLATPSTLYRYAVSGHEGTDRADRRLLSTLQDAMLSLADACERAAVRSNSGYALAYFELGNVALVRRDTRSAIRNIQHALDLRNDVPIMYSALARAFVAAGQLRLAVEHFKYALKLRPGALEVSRELGAVYRRLGRLALARRLLEAVAEVNDEDALTLAELGRISALEGDSVGAAAKLRRSLELDPSLVESLLSLASLHWARGDVDGAWSCVQRAARVDPDSATVAEAVTAVARRLWLPDLADRAQYVAYASGLSVEARSLLKASSARSDVRTLSLPWDEGLSTLAPPHPGAQIPWTSWQVRYTTGTLGNRTRAYSAAAPEWLWGSAADVPGHRIRLGYCTRHLLEALPRLEALLQHHDHVAFDVRVYVVGGPPGVGVTPLDPTSPLARAHARLAAYIPATSVSFLRGLPIDEVAHTMSVDELDVLVLVDGSPTTSRQQADDTYIPFRQDGPLDLQLIEWHPARHVVGAFATSSFGTASLDYVVADRVVAPGGQQQYEESTLWLPLPSLATAHRTLYSEEEGTSSTTRPAVLPDADALVGIESVVLASFAPLSSVDAGIAGAWFNVLRQAPSTVLWLRGWDTPLSAQTAFRLHATLVGVDASRIRFLGVGSADPLDEKRASLRRLARVSVYLDTAVGGDFETVADALWMGTPVVTLAGQTVASRVALAALDSMCGPDACRLATTNLVDYERRVLNLLESEERRLGLVDRLLSARQHASVFDLQAWTVAFEHGLRAVSASAGMQSQED